MAHGSCWFRYNQVWDGNHRYLLLVEINRFHSSTRSASDLRSCAFFRSFGFNPPAGLVSSKSFSNYCMSFKLSFGFGLAFGDGAGIILKFASNETELASEVSKVVKLS